MAEPVIPGLTLNSDGAYTVGAATIPATDELTAGQLITVNSKIYTLVKYLGGGTYGKVWSATGPDGLKYSIKFIYVDYGVDTPENIQYTKDATLAVINEARITKKLYETTQPHPICSDIHGIGSTAGYMIVVMDIFEITLDWYLEHGGSAEADELVRKLYNMLKRVNNGGMKTSHGDVKGDNFMINSDGTLRAVDFGFGHIQEEGLDIQCNNLNSNNIGMERDIVQFVIYLTLFYRSRVSKPVANAVANIIGTLVSMKKKDEFKEKSLWSIAYRYLNQAPHGSYINIVASNIIARLTILESHAVPFTLPVEDEPDIEDFPEDITSEPLPTRTTIAATIEDKMTIRTGYYVSETVVKAAETQAVAEAAAAEETLSGNKRSRGGARKTRRRRNAKNTRKAHNRRKTRTLSNCRKMLK
jgi:serine/threonine protein kinase